MEGKTMCCFSKPVKAVADTCIFARPGQAGRQFLVYSMRIDASEDLAMVLPIPVTAKPMEGDVRFFNFEEYPEFFDDLAAMYPRPRAAGGVRTPETADEALKLLPKISVGSYEASFVPTVHDFERLDPAFRMPPDAWTAIPQYLEYSFAVFKLKPGVKKIHPMAFDFPRRNPAELFFPTVHIHDGEVHELADFDHMLFMQLGAEGSAPMEGWFESSQHANSKVSTEKTHGFVLPEAHVYRRKMVGNFPNRDILIEGVG